MDILSDPRSFDGACRDLVELVTEYLEDTLPPQVHAAVERHLDECADCAEFVAQSRVTVAATGSLRADSLPASTQHQLIQAFRDQIRPHGPTAVGPS